MLIKILDVFVVFLGTFETTKGKKDRVQQFRLSCLLGLSPFPDPESCGLLQFSCK